MSLLLGLWRGSGLLRTIFGKILRQLAREIINHDFCGVTIFAALGLPFPGSQLALKEQEITRFNVHADVLSSLVETDATVPFSVLFPFASFPVLERLGCSD